MVRYCAPLVSHGRDNENIPWEVQFQEASVTFAELGLLLHLWYHRHRTKSLQALLFLPSPFQAGSYVKPFESDKSE